MKTAYGRKAGEILPRRLKQTQVNNGFVDKDLLKIRDFRMRLSASLLEVFFKLTPRKKFNLLSPERQN
jgi:hypothetical protein